MPRTSALEAPGCPPLRALTTDVLGLVKVVEARGKEGKAEFPKVVDTWGSPDASRAIHAASFLDHPTKPLLALARKDYSMEILNPLNGQVLVTKVAKPNSSEQICEEDPIVALHILNSRRDSSSGSNIVLTCTEKGKSCLSSVELGNSTVHSQSAWDVCQAGKVICSAVNAEETRAVFGGKGIELNVWDLDNCNKTWTSKAPPPNSLGIHSPTWFTAATFLSKEHNKIAAGTNDCQVRLYDISAQRKAVIAFSFRESPIKAVAPDLDGNRIYVGTGIGDLASFDMRTGKMVGCFIGKCSGSIRSIARHPKLPLLASCGLDRYLRIWDTNSRRLLSVVFLKQHLTNVMFDSHFDAGNTDKQPSDTPDADQIEGKENDDDVDTNAEDNEEDDELWIALLNEEVEKEKQRLKRKKKKKLNKAESKQNKQMKEDEPCGLSEDDSEQLSSLKRRKSSSSNGKKERSKKLKKSGSKGE